MVTAKSLQLLDANNNNISPATNIETIYYEYQLGGLVKRNHIFKHFPVYVNHAYGTYDRFNFNEVQDVSNFIFYDNNYYTKNGESNKSTLLDSINKYNESIKGHTNKKYINVSSNILKADNASINPFDISKGLALDASGRYQDLNETAILKTTYIDYNGESHEQESIYVSAISQEKFKNTDFKMLNVSTYNLTEILSHYASNNWVHLSHEALDTKIENATLYHADYYNDPIIKLAKTLRTIGSINAGTPLVNLDGQNYDVLFDEIFGVGLNPLYKPLIATVTVPLIYYMTYNDLKTLENDPKSIMSTSDGLSYANRYVTIKNTKISITHKPMWSFDYISEKGSKWVASAIKQSTNILGSTYSYKNNGLLNSINGNTNTETFALKNVIIKPSLLLPYLTIQSSYELKLKLNAGTNSSIFLNILKNTRKSNNTSMFKKIVDVENYFKNQQPTSGTNIKNTIPLITIESYSKLPSVNKTQLVTAIDHYYNSVNNGINEYACKIDTLKIIPAYPIYYGNTMLRKSMKIYWAYGQKLHKIPTLLDPNKEFYIGIPKIVVNQLVDPFPHLYKILQESRWQTANDWVIERTYNVDEVILFFKIARQYQGIVKDILFTVDFTINNIRAIRLGYKKSNLK